MTGRGWWRGEVPGGLMVREVRDGLLVWEV